MLKQGHAMAQGDLLALTRYLVPELYVSILREFCEHLSVGTRGQKPRAKKSPTQMPDLGMR